MNLDIGWFCSKNVIRDSIYSEVMVSIPNDWNNGLQEVLGLEPVNSYYFLLSQTYFIALWGISPENNSIIYFRMEVSEIDHFKRVQAAKGIHGSISITGPTQFW